MYILNYNSLTEIKGVNCVSRFAGSGSFKQVNDNIIRKKTSNREYEITGNIYNNFLKAVKYCDILDINTKELGKTSHSKNIANYKEYINRYTNLSDFVHEKKHSRKKEYKINKSKVRKKITALCRLSSSKKFLAFYSISFPASIKDDEIYIIFNRWLTNCRKRYGLNTYVWVAERQNNKTLHFHLLTNNYMQISDVNRAMSAAIQTSVKNGRASWGASSSTLYNGVDVDSIQHQKKRQYETREMYRKRMKRAFKHSIKERVNWATSYMTKYMTKQDETFTHLASHCSRNISQLFTSIILSDNDIDNYLSMLDDNAENYKVIEKERLTIYVFKKVQIDIIYSMIDKLNNYLYEMYNNNKKRLYEMT